MNENSLSTREQILDVVIRQMEAHGEHSVRTSAIAESLGITQPALYHHFKNKEEMVVAALARRFRTNLDTTIDPFVAAVAHCKNREEFALVVRDVYLDSLKKGRQFVRETRVELIGASVRRQEIRQQFLAELDDSLAASIAALELAQSRGWLAPHINPRAFALYNFSVISSAVIPEMYGDEAIRENWIQISIDALMNLLLAN